MAIGDAINSAAKNAALGNLGAIMQSPLARAVVRYWWVSIPIGYAAYLSYTRRKAKEGKAHPIDVLSDVAPIVGLMGTLVAVNATLEAQEARSMASRAAAAAAPRPVQGATIREAEFTVPPARVEG